MGRLENGFLINLEGGEGCGKTCHVPQLVESLREKGFTVFPTREPGGTSIGEQIRGIIHSLENYGMHPKTETLLFQAARAQIVEQVIKPRLKEGEVVICDRFFDSTIAYQGFGRQLDINKIYQLIDFATGGLTPDLTVLLDVEVEEGLRRKKKQDEWNRMDDLDKEIHQRVHNGYLKMASVDVRWVVVNANNSIEEVRNDLIGEIGKRLSYYVNNIEGEQKKCER